MHRAKTDEMHSHTQFAHIYHGGKKHGAQNGLQRYYAAIIIAMVVITATVVFGREAAAPPDGSGVGGGAGPSVGSVLSTGGSVEGGKVDGGAGGAGEMGSLGASMGNSKS